MTAAGIEDRADVHYVQTKTPLLVLETINDAKSRGHDVVTEDTLKSMDISNSTTALGIAVALGEIEMPAAEQIHKDLSLSPRSRPARRASSSTGRRSWWSATPAASADAYRIGHGVMRDALDADGIWAAIRSAGLELPERPHTETWATGW